jgi:ABC-2 type transport system permease protein
MALSDGVIHDIGYQRYTGRRLGRGYAAASLYTHSLRTAFGLGRSAKAKAFPFIVVGLAFLVAVVAVALRSQDGSAFINYLQYCDAIGTPMLLFVAIVAPELVSRDLRARTLPVYFSRPIRRTDYALVKLAAMISAMWLVLAAPLLLIFLGAVFSPHTGVVKEAEDFVGGLGYAAIYSIIFSSLGILVASLASRRAVAAGVIVAVFLIPAPVVGVFQLVGSTAVRQLSRTIDPIFLVQGLRGWIYHTHTMSLDGYGPAYLIVAVLLVGACVSLLTLRYRRVSV